MIIADADFQTVRGLLAEYAGIELADTKRQMVCNRLSKPMAKSGSITMRQYLNKVETSPLEREHFINALTTNVTSFFREAHHFSVLADHLQNRLDNAKVWSAGCSTGQEPYSMVMHLADKFPCVLEVRRAPLIIATDLDTQALAYAKSGTYSHAELKGLSPAQCQKYFDQTKGDRFQVKAIWRRLVDFKSFNLCGPSDQPWKLPWGKVDAIFCRNVMIYFGLAQQRRITGQFIQALNPNGLFFAGHSEMMLHSDSLLKSIGQTVYHVDHAR